MSGKGIRHELNADEWRKMLWNSWRSARFCISWLGGAGRWPGRRSSKNKIPLSGGSGIVAKVEKERVLYTYQGLDMK